MWHLQLVPGLGVQARLGYSPVLSWDEPWRALTAAFVHAQPSPLHLLFNMIGVFFFGSFIERAAGSVFFGIAYLLSALGGSVLTLLLALAGISPPNAMYVGASGAVFGIVGTLLAPTKRLDRNLGGVIGFVLLNVLVLFFDLNIAWEAHPGGLLVGFVLGCARFLPPPRLVSPQAMHGPVPVLSPGQVLSLAQVLSPAQVQELNRRIAKRAPVGAERITVAVHPAAGKAAENGAEGMPAGQAVESSEPGTAATPAGQAVEPSAYGAEEPAESGTAATPAGQAVELQLEITERSGKRIFAVVAAVTVVALALGYWLPYLFLAG